MESLINKATSPIDDNSDEYIDKFIGKLKLDPLGAVTSTRLLAHKIQSPQEQESLKSLTCLVACVKYCGEPFERELGKYRFLNELIKVVSPKYLGKQSTDRVKNKVISMLYTWSCHFVKQNKIRDAYQMLKKQGIITVDPPFDHSLIMHVPPPRNQDDLFKDAEKKRQLSKLLKSKNPDDLQAANILIQSIVEAENLKLEKMKRRNELLEEASNNVKLLTEMLEVYSEDKSQDDIQTMKELFDSCQKLRPSLFRLASDTEDNEQALMEILKANDDLSKVMNSFEQILVKNKNSEGEGLQDLLTDMQSFSMQERDIQQQASTSSNNHFYQSQTDEELLLNMNIVPKIPTLPNIESSPPLFSQKNEAQINQLHNEKNMNFMTSSKNVSEKSEEPTSLLSDIDELSSGLIEMSLGRKPARISSQPTPKPTLKELQMSNQVEKERKQQETTKQLIQGELSSSDVVTLPLNMQPATGLTSLLSPEGNCDVTQPSDDMSWMTSASTMHMMTLSTMRNNSAVMSPEQIIPPASLNDVVVTLGDIKPSNHPPITVHDIDNIRVLLHFSCNHASSGRTDTLVCVLSIINTKACNVENVNFQVAVPKIMRVKLQAPSSTFLKAYNPIQSTPTITQVIIIANTSNKEVKLRYKLEYKIENEIDKSTYSGTISGFPSNELWGKL